MNLTRVSFSAPPLRPPPKNNNNNCRKRGLPAQKSLENGLKQLSRDHRSVETTRSSIINKLDHGFRIPQPPRPRPPPPKKNGENEDLPHNQTARLGSK